VPVGLYALTLSTRAYGGEALGRLEDGRAVFVPFALPGERVRVRLVEEKERFARGELVELLQASPERIAPRCKHFGTCGGCHYQHMPYAAQVSAKAEILRDQLMRIGHIESPPMLPPVSSARPWNYRNQVQFQLTEDGRLAYVRAQHEAGSARNMLGIEECHLPEASINSLWPQLELGSDSNIERVSIRAGTEDDILLLLESDTPELPVLEIEAGISVAHLFQGDRAVLAGEDHVTMRVLGRDFRVSAPSFFQVNTAMAEQMVQHVTSRVPGAVSTLLDVYCGVGLFSAFLAPRCQRLIGIESSPAACEDYGANLDEFDNVELYEDVAERVLPALDVSPDVVVLDPPRAGLELAALDAIARMAPAMIAYASCDPSTLARDAARLVKAGYQLMAVTLFDLFPQTYHIESISLFER
jgi:23S rRNA (uracil1939-C5)-methyltransferase